MKLSNARTSSTCEYSLPGCLHVVVNFIMRVTTLHAARKAYILTSAQLLLAECCSWGLGMDGMQLCPLWLVKGPLR